MKNASTRLYVGFLAVAGIWTGVGLFTGEYALLSTLSTFTINYQWAVLLSVFLVGLVTLFAGVTFVLSFTRGGTFKNVAGAVISILEKKKGWLIWTFAGVGLGLLAGQFLLAPPYLGKSIQRSFLLLLRPFFLWLVALSFLSLVWALAVTDHHRLLTNQSFYLPLLFSLGVSVILVFLTNRAGIGFSGESKILGLFHPVGFPLLGYQVFLCWLGCTLVMGGLYWVKNTWRKGTGLPPVVVDILLGVLLFALAFSLWNPVPLKPNWFVDQPRPPNFEHYPNSDARFYDTNAQNLLAMGRYWSIRIQAAVGRRPVMLLFHALLHRINGLGYEAIIPMMVAGFSILPVLLYALGTTLHSRLAGLLAGLLFIIRHRNGLLLGDVITGANVKMLMSDFPTTFGVVFFVLLFVRWLKDPKRRIPMGLLAGGVLGATMLVRIEVGLILPLVSVPAFFVYRGRVLGWLKGMALVSAGLLLFVIPWVGRNYVKTGTFYLEEPGNKVGFILKTVRLLASKDGEEVARLEPKDTPVQPQVTPSPPQGGQQEDIQGETTQGGDQDTREGPEPIPSKSEILANHFVNGVVESVLYLPHTPLALDMDYLSQFINQNLDKTYGGLLYAPEKYVRKLPYWWQDWDGRIQTRSLIGFGVTVVFIGFGMYALWDRHRATAFVPLLSMLAGITIYTAIRYSGGRFLQKADWVTSFYFSVGLAELTIVAWKAWGRVDLPLFSAGKGSEDRPRPGPSNRWTWVIVPVGLLLAGSIFPLVEWVLPTHYPQAEVERKVSFLTEDENSPFSDEEIKTIHQFMSNGGAIVYGRALYPRYFQEGEKLFDEKKPREYPALTFYVTGTGAYWTSVSRRGVPDVFPHGEDVLVFGCPRGSNMDAVLVALWSSKGQEVQELFWRDGDLGSLTGCPLPPPEG